MLTDAWAVVTAALGSSSLTLAGTFGLERWRHSRVAKVAENDRIREACVQMGGHALTFVLRVHALYLTAVFRSGLPEGLDIALYHRKPVDPRELADWLLLDLGPMLKAQSVIEVTAGEDLVRATNNLVLAATEVLDVASSVGTKRGGSQSSAWRRIASGFRRLVPLRRDPQLEKEIQHAVRQLGRELHKFARMTRESLGVNDPDVVIRAFPELFDNEASPGLELTHTNNDSEAHEASHVDEG